MNIFDALAARQHEQVVFGQDAASGYRGIIAIHSTARGPALGGTRFWSYANEDDAFTDALRLSRAMTYKAAAAGLPLGGGKSVILAPAGTPSPEARERILRAHGRLVETLGGRYIAGEDVGTGQSELAVIRKETRHVAGVAAAVNDPSPWTALGVRRGIQAALQHRFGSDSLQGKTVAIQGCGQVGYRLARELHALGAQLIVSDVSPLRAQRVVVECEARAVEPETILAAKVDVLAPCALGGVFDDRTIPALECAVVAGSANNQLLEDRHGDALAARGILYAPDYVVNAGGLVSGAMELFGWSEEDVRRGVEGIYDTTTSVFQAAAKDGVPPSRAADRLAEERLRAAGEDRRAAAAT